MSPPCPLRTEAVQEAMLAKLSRCEMPLSAETLGNSSCSYVPKLERTASATGKGYFKMCLVSFSH